MSAPRFLFLLLLAAAWLAALPAAGGTARAASAHSRAPAHAAPPVPPVSPVPAGPAERASPAESSAAVPGLPGLPGLEGEYAPAPADRFARDNLPAWRIRFLEAAVVRGDSVTLGEVAAPLGPMPPELWRQMAGRPLWPSPPPGRPMNMTRPRLQEAVAKTMNDLAPYCLFPGSLAVQRGGVVYGREAVQTFADRQLTPRLAGLPGEVVLKDFRLPNYVFMENAQQTLELETPKRLEPGRLSLRLVVRELDGRVRQKLTGTVFVECWTEVPVAAMPLNKDDMLDHNRIAFKRVNLAALRGAPWDGRGGPWRMTRPVGPEQVIYQMDVGHIPTVRKGAPVNLIYEGRSVRLAVRAEAMADGAAGETIPVRNLQSRKEVLAMVQDAGNVIIRSDGPAIAAPAPGTGAGATPGFSGASGRSGAIPNAAPGPNAASGSNAAPDFGLNPGAHPEATAGTAGFSAPTAEPGTAETANPGPAGAPGGTGMPGMLSGAGAAPPMEPPSAPSLVPQGAFSGPGSGPGSGMSGQTRPAQTAGGPAQFSPGQTGLPRPGLSRSGPVRPGPDGTPSGMIDMDRQPENGGDALSGTGLFGGDSGGGTPDSGLPEPPPGWMPGGPRISGGPGTPGGGTYRPVPSEPPLSPAPARP